MNRLVNDRPGVDAHPRPPLLERVPSSGWSLLVWCAAGLVAVAIASKPPEHMKLLGGWLWAVVAVLLALPIGLALRRPVPVLWLVLAGASVTVALGRSPLPLLLAATDLLVLYHAAAPPPAARVRPVPSRRATALVAAAALSAQLVQVCAIGDRGLFGHFWSPDPLVVLSVVFAVVVAWTVGDSIRQRREYVESLRRLAAEQAVQAERLRIAREMHDLVAHNIGVITIQSGAAGLVLETQPAAARRALGLIETTGRETLAGLRAVLGSLRGPEAPATGLADLDRFAAATADSGVRVQVQRRGQRRQLEPQVDLSAFRIIQESVTNVVRHAAADRCRVTVDYLAEELAVEIVDDGRGASAEAVEQADGYGIAGMRERVDLLHGRFSAGPRPEGGFRVTARLPA